MKIDFKNFEFDICSLIFMNPRTEVKYLVDSRVGGSIDVRKGVLGGLTPSLRLKIWDDPPPLENF